MARIPMSIRMIRDASKCLTTKSLIFFILTPLRASRLLHDSPSIGHLDNHIGPFYLSQSANDLKNLYHPRGFKSTGEKQTEVQNML